MVGEGVLSAYEQLLSSEKVTEKNETPWKPFHTHALRLEGAGEQTKTPWHLSQTHALQLLFDVNFLSSIIVCKDETEVSNSFLKLID